MFSSLLLHVSVVHSFLLQNSILLNECVICLFILLLMAGHLGSFLFGAFTGEIALIIFVSAGIFFHILSKYLGVELPIHWVHLFNFIKSGYTVIQFQQQCMNILVASHLH